MTAADGLGPVAEAVRKAFVDAEGRPVAVRVRRLDAADFRGRGRVVVPDAATVAELVPSQRVTGAVVVADEDATVLLHTDDPEGARLAPTAAGVDAATAELTGTVSRLRAEAGVVDALHSIGRRLTAQLERERTLAAELSRSMVPAAPRIPGLDLVTRYLPAATGSKVGGDWFDVLRLGSGATAFVIGDVVGHGVTAATVMGQVRTAIRSYALLELPPSKVLRNVSQLTSRFAEPSFVTCFYAVHEPADHSLTYANAGHLPAVLVHADGTPEQIGEALAQPLGVGAEFPQEKVAFPPETDLLLYTDGPVESRTRDLTLGIGGLLAALGGLRAGPDAGTAWDRLIHDLTGGSHDDDIALIHVRRRDGGAA
ncbi:PP2C family protein-serine/threonine phosphatase [Amycolatopsis sp. NPDC023774]|uniref:PP2C family protein-serine/threonine phosphatase n=1 Tax=Amycolatopsis sp. NPDC023774 TaxID=3155015 RepID=UPI0033D57074